MFHKAKQAKREFRLCATMCGILQIKAQWKGTLKKWAAAQNRSYFGRQSP